MSSPASAPAPCAACGATTLLVCASCLKTRFCSPACAAAAWAGHRAACAEFTVLSALPDDALEPVPPAAPLASSVEPAAGAGAPEPAGTGFECAVCGKADAAVCARCRLVGYCGVEHQRKDWPTHKAVCRKGEASVVPVQSWEQRMLAEAHAAAPASLAATAALPAIPEWDPLYDGAPPTKMLRAWQKAAEGGHSRAQLLLGFCLIKGFGVAKDAKAAAEWFAKSAAQGYAPAQVCLADLFDHGTGVAQDCNAAAALYAKAAAQGNASAQTNLGVLYERGRSVAQDFKAAAALYAKAAAQGVAAAQCNLGSHYANGTGVPKDSTAAAAWFAKAAAQGDAKAQCYLGVLFDRGDGVAQDFKAAAAWYAKAAAQGDAKGQLNLGVLYSRGSGVAQDFKVAAAWYTKAAAAQGDATAQFNLGTIFEKGTGVAQDFKAAAAWYAKAAAAGDTDAPARRDACLARAAAAAGSTGARDVTGL